MAVLFLVFSAVIGRVSAECVAKAKGAETDKNGDTICICVDAGHGGTDPGKVGVNNIEEKEINLQIAKKLRTSLEKQGFQVVMTRTGDADLSEAGADNTKVSDMRNRVAFIKKRKRPLPSVFIRTVIRRSLSTVRRCFITVNPQRGKSWRNIYRQA